MNHVTVRHSFQKNKKGVISNPLITGADEQDRTADLLITNKQL